MSYPAPIIPQTAEQAVQRDTIAGLVPVLPDDPAVELARLREAVRAHREAQTAAGPIVVDEEHWPALTGWIEANVALWRHLPEVP